MLNTYIRLVCNTYPWSDASTIRQNLYLFNTFMSDRKKERSWNNLNGGQHGCEEYHDVTCAQSRDIQLSRRVRSIARMASMREIKMRLQCWLRDQIWDFGCKHFPKKEGATSTLWAPGELRVKEVSCFISTDTRRHNKIKLQFLPYGSASDHGYVLHTRRIHVTRYRIRYDII
jgi:hypothetical protein